MDNINKDYKAYCEMLKDKSAEELKQMIESGDTKRFTLTDSNGHYLEESIPIYSFYHSKLLLKEMKKHRKTNFQYECENYRLR